MNQRNSRLNVIMSMVSETADDTTNSIHDQLPNETVVQEKNTKHHEYSLRESAKRTYCEENDMEINEDFSPYTSTSEYVPSPERLANLRQLSQSSSSFGGDSDYLITASQNISRTPSTVSNVSYILNAVDFIASPSIVFENRQLPDTNNDDDATCCRLTPSASRRRILSTRRCLNYSVIPEEDNLASIVNQDDDQQKEFNTSTGSELTLNQQNLVSAIDTFDLDETLKPDNSSDGKLADCTLVSYQNVTSSSNDLDLSLVSQSEVDNNHSVINYTGYNEDNHQTNNMTGSQQMLAQTEGAVASTDQVSCSIHSTTNITNVKTLTRKRIRNDSERQDQTSKKLKNSGKPYIGCRSKKQFEKKALKAVCKCTKKCGDKFTQEQREAIMLQYYELADHERQWKYIVKHTIAEDVKRVTVVRKNNRTQSIKYYFNLDEEKVQVCKTFFINTLSVSHQTVYTALDKFKSDEGLIDNRGHHDNRPRKMSIQTEQNIMQHIQLFPTMESHYTRKDSNRQYLSELLNISKMYRLYQTWFQTGNYDCPMATKRQYETIFNSKFNFSFFKPKKDQCVTCTLYRQADPVRQETLLEKYDQHQKKKDRVRQIRRKRIC